MTFTKRTALDAQLEDSPNSPKKQLVVIDLTSDDDESECGPDFFSDNYHYEDEDDVENQFKDEDEVSSQSDLFINEDDVENQPNIADSCNQTEESVVCLSCEINSQHCKWVKNVIPI